jgi:myo-inositol-1(or 4)-monophosphatase
MTPGAAELRDLAAACAREAGELVARRANDPRTAIATKSSPTDMVSEVDRESEALIVSRLLAARPGDGILGEEGGERTATSGVRWLIDPLDGTTNYLYGYPAFCVSIAAERDGSVVAGAVFDVSRGEMYAAAAGQGATRDGQPLAVSGLARIDTALLATGFGYDPAQRARQGAVLAAVVPAVRDIRRSGSAALDLCGVACGRLDGYFELGLGPWDWAAGALIVREAGGETLFVERDGRIRLVVATSAGLLAPLRQLLSGAGVAEAVA